MEEGWIFSMVEYSKTQNALLYYQLLIIRLPEDWGTMSLLGLPLQMITIFM